MAARDYSLTIVVIGPKNAGKTVYLSALADSPGVCAADSATARALKLHWEALGKGENPPATAATLTNCVFSFNGRTAGGDYSLPLRIPDYDGHFAEILSEHESGAKEIGELRKLTREADGFIVLMPADAEDAAAMEALRIEIGSFIEAARSGDGAKIERPLIVAVNKWDVSPHFRMAGEDEAARAFIESVPVYRDILEKLQSHFTDVIILPLSAYGHAAEDGKPGAAGLTPYRVEEPLLAIVDAAFASLKARAEKLEQASDWTGAARLLLDARPLWKRLPGDSFAPLLKKALQKCGEKLVTELGQAKTAQEFERIWNASPAREFADEFAPARRDEIEALRARALAATHAALAQKLGAARDRAEYERILQSAPEGKHFASFDPEQRAALQKLAERGRRGERRRRGFRGALIGLALLVCAAAAWGVWSRLDFSRGFAEAMNPALEPGAQWHALARFITRHESSPVASRLFAAEIDEARKKRASLVGAATADIAARLREAAAENDACSRASRAERLLEEVNSPGLNAPQGLINEIDILHDQSGRLCQAAERIAGAKNAADLDAAEKLLAHLPRSPESDALRERLRARAESAAEAEAASPEGARLSALREEFARLEREGGLEEAENFVSAHRNDPSEEARRLADRLDEGMGERLYRALLGFVRQMKTFGDEELGPLKDLAARRHPLDAAQRRILGEELQKLAERRDRELLAAIPEKAANRAELEAAEAALKGATAYPASLRLGDGLFRYRRPDDLEYELASRAAKIAAWRKALADGVEARDAAVAAARDNSLNLHGRRAGSAFTKNSELTVRFPGDIGELSWRTSPMSDHEEDGGAVYSLNFGPLLLRPAAGEVQLREENFGGADLACSSSFEISDQDILALLEGGVARKPLGGTCKGLSIIFRR